MMNTTIDIAQAIYRLLKNSPVPAAISGGIYYKRPVGSLLEDIVINSLPITAYGLQEGTANVNIHVQNLQLTIAGQPDNSQPNIQRLQQIAALVIPILEDAFINDITITIQQQTLFEEAELREHYLNLRLQIFSPNI
jgi:hypothetical protein